MVKTFPRSTAHQGFGVFFVELQLPTLSKLGFLLPSTAKDGPRPSSMLDWNVGLRSAAFTGVETNNLYISVFITPLFCTVKIAVRKLNYS